MNEVKKQNVNYTKRKSISFSKDNLDVYDYLSEQANYSALICDIVRKHMEDELEEKVYNESLEDLKQIIQEQSAIIDNLRGEIKAYQKTINILSSNFEPIREQSKVSEYKEQEETNQVEEKKEITIEEQIKSNNTLHNFVKGLKD